MGKTCDPRLDSSVLESLEALENVDNRLLKDEGGRWEFVRRGRFVEVIRGGSDDVGFVLNSGGLVERAEVGDTAVVAILIRDCEDLS